MQSQNPAYRDEKVKNPPQPANRLLYMRNLFEPGEFVVTKGVVHSVPWPQIWQLLGKHMSGTWGEVPAIVTALNVRGVQSRHGGIVSRYAWADKYILVVTETDGLGVRMTSMYFSDEEKPCGR